jgi:hypothetical protein
MGYITMTLYASNPWTVLKNAIDDETNKTISNFSIMLLSNCICYLIISLAIMLLSSHEFLKKKTGNE